MQNSSSPGREFSYFNSFSFAQQTSPSYSYEILQPGPESGISSHPEDCYYTPAGYHYDQLVPEHYHVGISLRLCYVSVSSHLQQNRPNMFNSANSARQFLRKFSWAFTQCLLLISNR
jgi:hypothetical protein